jgi:1-deoxy-D-xylulose-5-phosphate synthase
MSILEGINSPADLRGLSRDQLRTLAQDMRERLIDVCSRTGGHIGAGLGVVELTIQPSNTSSPGFTLDTRPSGNRI